MTDINGNQMRILLHPFIIISWLITAISISLAFYFYSDAQNFPQLSYTIRPIRGIVVRSGHSSKMTVRYGDTLVETDITAVQIVLWNGGKKAIKKADILKPITIHTEKNVPILEASILKTTRDIIHPSLNTDEIQMGVANLTWDILEQDDGCTVQIIYEGKPDININIDGAVEGQGHLSLVQAPEGTIYRKEFNRSARKDFEVYSLAMMIMGMLVIPLLAIARDPFPIYIRIPLILILFGCIGVVFYHYLYGYVEPPFGF
jgi:hypothetical protein